MWSVLCFTIALICSEHVQGQDLFQYQYFAILHLPALFENVLLNIQNEFLYAHTKNNCD